MVGAEFLSERKQALLADEMGLGKSCQAIRAADMLYLERILVLCPAVARVNWIYEFEKFSFVPRAYKPIFTAKDKLPDGAAVVTCSYDVAVSIHKALIGVKWDAVICDEAHFLKNRKAKRTQLVFGHGSKQLGALINNARYLWCLSGTPAPNNFSEMWPMLKAFGITDLTYFDFLNKYCRWYETQYGINVTGTRKERLGEIKDLLEPVMLRRKKDQVMPELPPVTWSDVLVEPGPVDKLLYFYDPGYPVREDPELDAKLAEEEAAANVILRSMAGGEAGIAALGAAQPALATLRRYTGLQKAYPVIELIKNEMEAGQDKIVLFCIHKRLIELLEMELKEFNPVTLYGGTPAHKRQIRVNKFQNNPKCRIFIGQIQACGTAVTLTSANQVLFVEADWVPANNAQAAMRVHRIGQKRNVLVRFVTLTNSLDQRIQKVLKAKTADLAQIFD